MYRKTKAVSSRQQWSWTKYIWVKCILLLTCSVTIPFVTGPVSWLFSFLQWGDWRVIIRRLVTVSVFGTGQRTWQAGGCSQAEAGSVAVTYHTTVTFKHCWPERRATLLDYLLTLPIWSNNPLPIISPFPSCLAYTFILLFPFQVQCFFFFSPDAGLPELCWLCVLLTPIRHVFRGFTFYFAFKNSYRNKGCKKISLHVSIVIFCLAILYHFLKGILTFKKINKKKSYKIHGSFVLSLYLDR